ncbi:MAG: hypothetical protein WAN65_17050, partial [Candidatus Sulfotelmatobacter sp.]
KLRGRIVELETAEKMTDRQLAAKVNLHFAKIAPHKSAPPKATAKKATQIIPIRKRTKKSAR